MTINPFTVYLIMQADRAVYTCQAILIGFIILVVIAICGSPILMEDDIVEAILKRIPKKTLVFLFTFALTGWTLIPSTKALCAMVVVPAIVNSQAVQKDFPELYDLAMSKLKEQLKPKIEGK